MRHIVILGNGIAGITAARHIRKRSDDLITVISGETDYFFSRTALMYIYMGHMKFEHTQPYEDWFWSKNNIQLKKGWVRKIDFDGKLLQFDNENIKYDVLILATGSKSNKFGWPGQELKGVQGLYSYQDLMSMETNTEDIRRAVIVGGGLIGIEMAEMLLSRKIPVTYLVREDHFWDIVLPTEEAAMIHRHILEHGVDLRLSTELDEILDDGNGHVKKVRTKSDESIECEFVGLTVGVHPNTEIVKDTNLETDHGILVDDWLQTSIPDVYAIGDCAQLRQPPKGRKAVEAVWYVGRIMGETVARTITGEKTRYDPGFWFNSAKFFDIEYQTYGSVPPQIPEDQNSFVWEDQEEKRLLRLVFEKDSKKITGVNALGIRLRHEVLDRWLQEGKKVDYCIQHFADAHFDPELFRPIHKEILNAYNVAFNESLGPRKKSWQRILEAIQP